MFSRAGIPETVNSTQKRNANQFAHLLKMAGITQADLAKKIEVHPNTVSKWATGAVKTPGPVRAYLRLRSFVMDAAQC